LTLSLSTKTIAALLFCGAIVSWSGAAAAADAPQGVKVGQYHVEMASAGSGAYTVIFESGFSGGMSDWQRVAPDVAKSAKVVVYTRSGSGKSDPRPEARTPQRVSLELDQLIEAAQLKPPFILVGHSYGGYLIRLFAARHPDKVAGMVFVDPSMERFNTELKKVDAAKLAQDLRHFDSLTPAAFKAESQLVDDAFTAAGRLPAPALPDVPSVVLTSTMVREKPEFFMHSVPAVAVWRKLHEQLFRQFSSGSHIVTATSGHNIHMEEPALVSGAIEQVIASATKLAKRRAHQLARASLMRSVDEAAVLVAARRGADAHSLIAAALKASQFSENEVNKLGYDVLARQPQVAVLVMQANSEAFAQSANAADSYGEVLLAAKQPALAKAQFLRAIELGAASGKGARSMDGYRGNLAKAEQALAAPN
jgi:pimeloyl-ACP methyl ester carboxylesterase